MIDALYRQESRRVLATLIRLLNDFELAEEALQDAFSEALKQWPDQGVPDNPRAWLVSAGRFKAIDKLRRQKKHADLVSQLTASDDVGEENPIMHADTIEDDQLRLIFTCCHPALSEEARVALTLREMCGLTTEQVASAFLISPSTLAQRIVRAKQKIKHAGIPYEVPERQALNERLGTVMQVIYLIFNEGYSASSGRELVCKPLLEEAIRLCRLLQHLLPDSEVAGLLALMLFQASRWKARTNADGQLVRLEHQDRQLWDQAMIQEADSLVRQALSSGRVGGYTIQAAIAGVHATANSYEDTDWDEILALYNLLSRMQRTPVVALNRAVALGMVEGAEAGLHQIDQLISEGQLSDYYLLYAARAHFCEQLGRNDEAASGYRQAIKLTGQHAEQEFMQQCLRNIEGKK